MRGEKKVRKEWNERRKRTEEGSMRSKEGMNE